MYLCIIFGLLDDAWSVTVLSHLPAVMGLNKWRPLVSLHGNILFDLGEVPKKGLSWPLASMACLRLTKMQRRRSCRFLPPIPWTSKLEGGGTSESLGLEPATTVRQAGGCASDTMLFLAFAP